MEPPKSPAAILIPDGGGRDRGGGASEEAKRRAKMTPPSPTRKQQPPPPAASTTTSQSPSPSLLPSSWDQPRPSSHRIPGRPMRLLYCDENGTIMVDPEAMAALQLIKGPVGVSTLTGPNLARTMESFADAINSGTVPTLSPSRQSVRETECGRRNDVALETDKTVVRKRKLEELMRLEKEEAEIRSRIAEKKQLGEQNRIKIEEAKEKLCLLDEQYKKDCRELQDLKGAVRVYLRICPILNEGEETTNATLQDDVLTLDSVPSHFDKIFADKSSQTEVFKEVFDLVERGIEGNKVCIFAYGQSGTGKTYSLIGELEGNDHVNAGLIPRALKLIFDQSKDNEYVVKLCVFEIYNGVAKSLTDSKIIVNWDMAATELKKVIKKRVVKGTALNDQSSRSHCFFQIEIRSPDNKVGEVCFVDLAGSEKMEENASKSQAGERQDIINSLFNLRQMLGAMVSNTQGGYRNCTLVKKLKPYLEAGSKTAILTTLSLDTRRIQESKLTLDFARKVKSLTLNNDGRYEKDITSGGPEAYKKKTRCKK